MTFPGRWKWFRTPSYPPASKLFSAKVTRRPEPAVGHNENAAPLEELTAALSQRFFQLPQYLDYVEMIRRLQCGL